MKKQLIPVLSVILAANLSLTSVASELSLSGEGSTTATTPSSFAVTEDMVADGVKIRIPASLDAEYNEAYGSLVTADKVTVWGGISENTQVIVKVPRNITYTNTTDSNTTTGYTIFGFEENGECISTWTAAQVALGADDVALADARDISVNIPYSELPSVGDYEADVEFDIAIGFLGLYTDICPPTNEGPLGTFSKYGTISGVYDKAKATYSFNESNQVGEVVNLNSARSYVSDCSNLYYVPSSGANTTVKYLQMSKEDVYYESRLDLSSPASFAGWINNFSNLSLLVVPGDIETEQLQGYTVCNKDGVNIQSRWLYSWQTHDYTDAYFDNSNQKVGNALAFVKDVDEETSKFVYVPHIVYRGTVEEWKALSGKDDWTFGNAANIVTVHCYDGNIVY